MQTWHLLSSVQLRATFCKPSKYLIIYLNRWFLRYLVRFGVRWFMVLKSEICSILNSRLPHLSTSRSLRLFYNFPFMDFLLPPILPISTVRSPHITSLYHYLPIFLSTALYFFTREFPFLFRCFCIWWRYVSYASVGLVYSGLSVSLNHSTGGLSSPAELFWMRFGPR